jgi:hypothetical protein
MIVILERPARKEDIERASEEYKSYIKVTADVKKEVVAIGGEYHYDAEQQLLKLGCNQEDIWGGGVDLKTNTIDTNAMINIRVRQNYSTEICDPTAKDKFIVVVKSFLPDYVAQ